MRAVWHACLWLRVQENAFPLHCRQLVFFVGVGASGYGLPRYLVSIYNFLEDQRTLFPSKIEQQTGSGRTSYVLMELCGDNLAVYFERQRRAGVRTFIIRTYR